MRQDHPKPNGHVHRCTKVESCGELNLVTNFSRFRNSKADACTVPLRKSKLWNLEHLALVANDNIFFDLYSILYNLR